MEKGGDAGLGEGASPIDNVDMKSSSSLSCTVANSWLKEDSLLDLNSLGLTLTEAGDIICEGDNRLEEDRLEAKMLVGGGDGPVSS